MTNGKQRRNYIEEELALVEFVVPNEWKWRRYTEDERLLISVPSDLSEIGVMKCPVCEKDSLNLFYHELRHAIESVTPKAATYVFCRSCFRYYSQTSNRYAEAYNFSTVLSQEELDRTTGDLVGLLDALADAVVDGRIPQKFEAR